MSQSPPPIAADAFFAREEELHAIRLGLAARRLVTVWGPAGIGKSRAIREFLRGHRGARVVVDVEHAPDEVALIAQVAAALEARLGADPETELVRALAASRELLLVVDSFEHLVPTCRERLDAWLKQAPELRVLVGSRTRLGLAVERAVELPPLATDAEEGLSPAARMLASRIYGDAGAADLDSAEAGGLVRIAARLQGLPLALELAAARYELLGLAGLERRLDDPLTLLAPEPSDPSRQGTMERAIGWSITQLGDADRRVFAWLGVFRGGFTVESAQAVVGGDPLPAIGRLRNAALLRLVAPGRFDLFTVVRACAERLLRELGETDSARRAHATWVSGLDLVGGHPSRFAKLWRAEQPNIEAAWAFSLETGELVLPLARRMRPHLHQRGPLRGLLAVMDRALEHAPDDPRFLEWRADTRISIGDIDGGVADAQHLHDVATTYSARNGANAKLSNAALFDGRIDALREINQRMLADAQAHGSDLQVCEAEVQLGCVAASLEDFEAARAGFDRAVALAQGLEDRGQLAFVWMCQVLVEHLAGDLDTALRVGERARALLAELERDRLEGLALLGIAQVQHALGRLDEARDTARRAAEGCAAVGYVSYAICAWCELAAICWTLDADEEAALAFAEARRLAAGSTLPLDAPLVQLYGGFAALAIDQADAARGALESANNPARGQPYPLVRQSPMAAFAARRLAEALQAHSRPVLQLGPGCAWFAFADGPAVDLVAHDAPRRVLQGLVHQHRRSPSQGLGVAELFAAGWPQEQIAPESARNRVHVALSRLRSLGLKALIVREGGAYRLGSSHRLVQRERG